MYTHKFDLEKFDGSNDFTLWKMKIKALRVQLGCTATLEGEATLLKEMTAENKMDILKKEHSVILSSLTYEVMRAVVDQTVASGLWDKLCDKYHNNSLTNRLCHLGSTRG